MDPRLVDAYLAAFNSASRGFRWDYPCLIWLADFVLAATGNDPALDYRDREWDHKSAVAALLGIVSREAHNGEKIFVEDYTAVAVRAFARRFNWPENGDLPAIGAYAETEFGVPAISIHKDQWLRYATSGAHVIRTPPPVIWSLA